MKGVHIMYVDPELKERIIKLKIQEGRTLVSLEDEFGISKNTISGWVKKYRVEAKVNAAKAKELADMEELARLKKEVEELKKENDFLKKAAAFFAKESK
jgi:transposase